MLEARMEEVRFDAKAPATIELQFVLKNLSEKEPIHLSERWNGWGNGQWTFTATTAAGQKLGFISRKDVWYKNCPSSFTIEPGKEFRCACTLTLDPDFGKGMESRYRVCRFDEKSNPQPLDFEPAWTFPLKLTGHFTAVVNSREEGGFTNWKGDIKTAEVTVKEQAEDKK